MQIVTKITLTNKAVPENLWEGRQATLEREVVRAIETVLNVHGASDHYDLTYDIMVTQPVETPEIADDDSWTEVADKIYAATTLRKIQGVKMLREEAKLRGEEGLISTAMNRWDDAQFRADHK